jgi:hypothetical protein
MPTITRVMIKTALLHALVGMLLSAFWLVEIAQPIHPLLRTIQPTALHIVVVGWLTQLIFGIAIWMFPPWSKEEPRGPSWLAWSCYSLLNLGLLLRMVAEPFSRYQPDQVWSAALVCSAIAQVVAIWLFVALVWRRVRPKPSPRGD